MSDANKFVNAYIDLAVSQLHEYLNNLLQVKAQLKVSNDLVSEKDALIIKLTQDLETNKADNQEIVKVRDQARKWEDAHNAMAGKVAHLDTALAQIAQMKNEVIERDKKIQSLQETIQISEQTIQSLQSEITELKTPTQAPTPTPKKLLNNKVKKETTNTLPQVEEKSPSVLQILEKQPTDDF